ncbi:hypothetical protein ACOME3_007004 [Neoechinorhynchus agilis]
MNDKVQMYQFMAKDNVPFHSIVFPCSLLGTGKPYNTVNHLIAIDYLMYEGKKFSKSNEVGIFADQAASTGIPCDVWRYYLLANRPETQDSNFSWDDLMLRNNGELLNNVGNFFNRSLSFCHRYYGGVVPAWSGEGDQAFERELLMKVNAEAGKYIDEMENVRLREALRTVMNISKLGNQYLQQRQCVDLEQKISKD